MKQAMRDSDTRVFWYWARQLDAREFGPKRRTQLTIPSLQPTIQEWSQYLALPGAQGGCAAVALPSPQSAFVWEQDGHLRLTDIAHVVPHVMPGQINYDTLWLQDRYQDFLQQLSNQKPGKAVPRWSAPADIWKMLLLDATPDTEQIRADVQQLLSAIWNTQRAPHTWHHSQVCLVDKQNNKIGCGAFRLINKLDPVGRCFYRVIWNFGNHPQYDFASGLQRGRRREQAILQQRVLHDRLIKTKQSFAFTKYDVRNAFPSISHESQLQYLQRSFDPGFRNLCAQRFQQSRITVRGLQNKEITMAVGSGSLQGDGIAGYQFTGSFNLALQRFLDAISCHTWATLCRTTEWLTNRNVDCALTSFVDDSAHTSVIADVNTLRSHQGQLDHEFQQALESDGFQSHPEKKTTMPVYVGKGAQQHYNNSFAQQPVNDKVQAVQCVYLGSTFAVTQHAQRDITVRIQAANRAWYAFARIWRQIMLPVHVRYQMFRTLVSSVLLSGLETLVLNNNNYARLETWHINELRQIIGAPAFKRDDNFVRVSLGAPTIESILRYRRLKWMQHIAAAPFDHVALRAVLFQPLPATPKPPLDNKGMPTEHAASWLKQALADLEHLTSRDTRFPATASLSKGLLDVFDPTSIFANNRLRPKTLLTCRLAIKQTVPRTLAANRLVCFACAADFSSLVALRCHCRRAHGDIDFKTISAITNQCPLCNKLFTTKFGAKQHMRRRAAHRCPQHNTYKLAGTLQPNIPEQIRCPFCFCNFTTLDSYNIHVQSNICGIRVDSDTSVSDNSPTDETSSSSSSSSAAEEDSSTQSDNTYSSSTESNSDTTSNSDSSS
ncbi:unnamed protein product [Polarella glacialis]|uniref:Reverse transcriptase domain-containing protein n=1 Tax=Polarella glacialis TaxID=89957 RepID=A0A813LSG8_POLGL|nr:unnamed protein product [Polarella glacialis]